MLSCARVNLHFLNLRFNTHLKIWPAEFQFNLDHLESKFMCLTNDIIYLFKLPAIIWQSISGHSKWPIYYVVFCRQYRNLWFGSDVSHNS